MLIKLLPEHFAMPSLNFLAFLKGEVLDLFTQRSPIFHWWDKQIAPPHMQAIGWATVTTSG